MKNVIVAGRRDWPRVKEAAHRQVVDGMDNINVENFEESVPESLWLESNIVTWPQTAGGRAAVRQLFEVQVIWPKEHWEDLAYDDYKDRAREVKQVVLEQFDSQICGGLDTELWKPAPRDPGDSRIVGITVYARWQPWTVDRVLKYVEKHPKDWHAIHFYDPANLTGWYDIPHVG